MSDKTTPNLKTLRSIFYTAIKEDVVPQGNNPFFKFKLKKGPTTKERLTFDEVQRIENLQLNEGDMICHVRDFFIFSFYCAGIRVGDGMQLKWLNIKDGTLTYKMDKTGVDRIVPLISKAKEILERYKKQGSELEHFIFPFLDNDEDLPNKKQLYSRISGRTTKINSYLKKIAERASIDKKLTSHVARHSFAEIARQKGVSLYDISKALGHSSLAITEKYLSGFDENSLRNAMGKIFG